VSAAQPGDVAREGRTLTERELNRAVLARQMLLERATGKCLEDVVSVARNHDSDRHLAVVRGVARVERAAARVEADFTADDLPERRRESVGIDVRFQSSI
jgi:hypothetical protein